MKYVDTKTVHKMSTPTHFLARSDIFMFKSSVMLYPVNNAIKINRKTFLYTYVSS